MGFKELFLRLVRFFIVGTPKRPDNAIATLGITDNFTRTIINQAMDAIEKQFAFKPIPEKEARILLRSIREYHLFQRPERVTIKFGASFTGEGHTACVLYIISTETDVPNVSQYGGSHTLREVFLATLHGQTCNSHRSPFPPARRPRDLPFAEVVERRDAHGCVPAPGVHREAGSPGAAPAGSSPIVSWRFWAECGLAIGDSTAPDEQTESKAFLLWWKRRS